MRKYHLLTIVILLAVNGACLAQGTADTVLNRYRAYLLQSLQPPREVEQWAGALDAQEQWPDINYHDTEPANWQVSRHLQRVRDLSLAWANPQSGHYHDARFLETIHAALDHWLQKRYKSSNWWHNEIGVPRFMRDIIILLGNRLSGDRRREALTVLHQLKVRGAGANLVWSADLSLHYGALTGDTTLIRHCSSLLAHEVKITTGDGIQPDLSFHQHGPRLQMYQYGAAFFIETTRLAWELRATPWAFPEDKIDILTDFLLEGWQWMARGIYTAPGTVDRSVSRPGTLRGADIRSLIPFLCALRPAAAEQFRAIAARQNGQEEPLTGFRYYPYSDFATFHRPGFAFFLKTISDRTLATESINHENIKGHLLNSGDAYLIRDGREYTDLMPVWNWERLPGVTTFEGARKVDRRPFNGSVSDGASGLTAMDYRLVGKDNRRLSAHKCWISHGDMIVCLIGGLQAEHISGNIFTALDQCRLRGAVTMNRPGHRVHDSDHTWQDIRWIHHAGFAYIPLKPATIRLQLKTATGSWSSINASGSPAPVSEKVFLPVLVQPAAQLPSATGYVLADCSSPRQAARLARKPAWTILRNDDRCQAAYFKDGIVAAAFFSADTLKLPGNRRLEVDKPCLLLLSGGSLYMSDPSHSGATVHLRIDGISRQVEMPKDGSSLEVKVIQ